MEIRYIFEFSTISKFKKEQFPRKLFTRGNTVLKIHKKPFLMSLGKLFHHGPWLCGRTDNDLIVKLSTLQTYHLIFPALSKCFFLQYQSQKIACFSILVLPKTMNDISMLNQPKLKVASFQKVRFIFQISKSPKKIIPKNYPQLEI